MTKLMSMTAVTAMTGAAILIGGSAYNQIAHAQSDDYAKQVICEQNHPFSKYNALKCMIRSGVNDPCIHAKFFRADVYKRTRLKVGRQKREAREVADSQVAQNC